MVREMYHRVTGWDKKLERCPFCGSNAEMWEYEPTSNHYQKVVMCSNGGDEDNDIEPCPMYMPPEGFYRDTKANALKTWNTRKAV